jgi:Lrp/AsnC family leucine-responsive transcriptional regulator
MKQILECYAITGEGDYLLKVIAPNNAALTEFIMKELLTLPEVNHVKTALALTSVKATTALPL